MSDRPLSIGDVTKALADTDNPGWPALPDHWYWCRRHTQKVKVGEFCSTTTTSPEGRQSVVVHVAESCVRIGPFMSEREANRLGGDCADGQWSDRALRPLGMEVEQ